MLPRDSTPLAQLHVTYISLVARETSSGQKFNLAKFVYICSCCTENISVGLGFSLCCLQSGVLLDRDTSTSRRGQRERSPPLTKITRSSCSHLEQS